MVHSLTDTNFLDSSLKNVKQATPDATPRLGGQGAEHLVWTNIGNCASVESDHDLYHLWRRLEHLPRLVGEALSEAVLQSGVGLIQSSADL